MILISFNTRGLGGTHKKNALIRIFSVNNKDVLFLKETMLKEETARHIIMSTLQGWEFLI